MSKGVLIAVFATVLLVLGGVGAFAYYKVTQAESAAAEAAVAEARAKQDLAQKEVQADIAVRAAAEQQEEAEAEAEKASAAAARKRDKKITNDVKSYAYVHYEDHKDPGSIYTWSYSSHKVAQRHVAGDGSVTVTVKIFATAQPPLGRARFPTSTHRLTYDSDGERTDAEVVGQTK